MSFYKAIQNDTDHAAAKARIEFLINAMPGAPEANELDVLSTLVEAYEKIRFPLDLPSPVDAIKFRMEQGGLKQRDLAPYIGSSAKVSEILSGKRQLTLKMIRALNEHLGIPAEVLIKDPARKLPPQIEGMEWASFPLTAMVNLGWIEKGRHIKEHAEEIVRELIGRAVGTNALPQPHYRKNDQNRINAKTDPYALQAWCLHVLATARSTRLEGGYVQGVVNIAFMTDLAKLSAFQDGPRLAKEYLSRYGIALVIAKHLPKTHLDGAAMETIEGGPVIGMTLRYDRLDNFWFCLMHELAHIGRHIDSSSNQIFVDDLTLQDGNDKEKEADEWAEEALIPKAVWKQSGIEQDASQLLVMELARRMKIAPAIVAGRVRHKRGNYRLLSKHVGNGEVRKHFPEYEG